jgi:hypothetical protein
VFARGLHDEFEQLATEHPVTAAAMAMLSRAGRPGSSAPGCTHAPGRVRDSGRAVDRDELVSECHRPAGVVTGHGPRSAQRSIDTTHEVALAEVIDDVPRAQLVCMDDGHGCLGSGRLLVVIKSPLARLEYVAATRSRSESPHEEAPQASPTIADPRTGAVHRYPRSASVGDAALDALRGRNPYHLHAQSLDLCCGPWGSSVRTWTI